MDKISNNNYQAWIPAFGDSSTFPTQANQVKPKENKDNTKLVLGTMAGLAILGTCIVLAREGRFGERTQNLLKGTKKSQGNGGTNTSLPATKPPASKQSPKAPQSNQQSAPIQQSPYTNDIEFLHWKKNGFKNPAITEMKDLPAYTAEAKRVTESFNNTHRIDFSERIPNGFRDGGRHLVFYNDGTFKNAYREIAIVDRENDIIWQKTLATFKARLAQNRSMTELEKTQELLKYVDDIFSVEADKNILVKHTENFPQAAVKIGDIINSGAGVCRHRALVAKLIADEVGLPMAIVRGDHGIPPSLGPHIWNEIKLSNGDSYIFDGMHKTLLNISDLEKRVDYQAFHYYSAQGHKLYFKPNSISHTIYGNLQLLQENVPQDLKFAEFIKLPGDEVLMTGKVQQSNLSVNGVIVNNTPIKLKLGDRVIVHNSTINDKIEFNIPTCGVKP